MKTGFTTRILHSDLESPIEHGAVHKPMHPAMAYGYEDAREAYAAIATPQAPQPVVDATIGQQAVDDACNCPGGSKPASMHAPNCPVRTTENK